MRYIPVIFAVVLIIYGLIDAMRTDPAEVRSLPKPAWILIILLLPLVGVLLWFFFGHPHQDPAATGRTRSGGRPATRGPATARAPQFAAPDDDPEFLRKLAVQRAQQAEAERLRKLQAEMDAREAKLRERELRGDQPNDEPHH